MIMQASVATDRGRPLEAIGVLDAAAAIAARAGDFRADKLALARSDALTQAGRLPEAIAEGKRAVNILEALAQREPAARVRLAAALGALAGAEDHSFHYDRALALLVRTLAIEEADYGADHPEVGKTLHDLANNEMHLRRFDDALAHYQRGRAIFAAAYGEHDRLVAMSDFSIGSLELQRGRDAEGRPYYDRALAEMIAAVGPEHPEVGRIEEGLGSVERDADRCKDAIPHFERALAIDDKAGTTGTDLAIDLTNLGACLDDVGRYAEARPLIERALSEFTAAGVSQRDRCEANAFLADLEWHAGRHARAIEIANSVIQVTEGAPPPYAAIHEVMQKQLAAWTRK
jgi:tetratricopeptide (TPR) repeat protein